MVVRKMKEKCKDAARMRREKERSEFVELSKLLPLPPSTTSQLDKASIIRLTSSYLRMRSAFPDGLGGNWGKDRITKRHLQQEQLQQQRQYHHHHHNQIDPLVQQGLKQQQQQQHQIRELGSLILQTLDGFVFALHKDGKIMYISETASVHLGLPQIDLTGSSIFEYVHPSDHNDIYEILSLNESDKIKLEQSTNIHCLTNGTGKIGDDQVMTRELGRSFCMRMKCILPKRNAGLVSSGYKAIHCNGYLKVKCKQKALDRTNHDSYIHGTSNEWDSYALVAVGHSLLPTASTEVKLCGNSFMFRANLDFKLYYVEAPVVKLLGFDQIEMIGQSLYNFVHLYDMHSLEESHKSLLEKSQVITKYYRLMKKDGGFVWIQSYASLVCNPRNMPKPQHIVSICFVLGEFYSDESCIPNNCETNSNLDEFVAASTNNVTTNDLNTDNSDNNQTKNQQRGKHNSTTPVTTPKKYQKVKHSSNKSFRSGESFASYESNTDNPHNVRIATDESVNLCQQQHYQSNNTAFVPLSGVGISSINQYPSIGSIRRPSDDTCSIVSSVASTSMSSQQSSSSSSSTSSEYMNYQNIVTSEYDHPKFNSFYNSTMKSALQTTSSTPATVSTKTTTTSCASSNLLSLDSGYSNATSNFETNFVDFNSNTQHYGSGLSEPVRCDSLVHQSHWLASNSCDQTTEDLIRNQGLSEQYFISHYNYQQNQHQQQHEDQNLDQVNCNSHYFEAKSPQSWFTNPTKCQNENAHAFKACEFTCHSTQSCSESLIYFQ